MRSINVGLLAATVTVALGLVTACDAGSAAAPGSVASPGSSSASGPSRPSISAQPAATTVTSPAAAAARQTCASGYGPGTEQGPVGASFISGDTGWLLLATVNECAGDSAVAIRKTADGGLHWSRVAAPPAPWGGIAPDGNGHVPAAAVTSVLFADARNGWAYGPGLWATHDSGLTWRRVATHGQTVQGMAATGGHAVAVFLNCDPQACKGSGKFTVETTPARADAWRPVSGATGQGIPSVTARAGEVFLVVSPSGAGSYAKDARLLTGPADGSARLVSRRLPCHPGAIALSATTARHLVLGCALIGFHPDPVSLYDSADSGVSWAHFATLPGFYDGASVVKRTANGTLLVGGMTVGVGLSYPGGRTWTWPAAIDKSNPVQGGGPIQADLVTDKDGYVIGWLGPLWITRDGGRTWRPVAIR